MKNFLLICVFLFVSSSLLNSQSMTYKLSGYLDTYYAIDNDGNFDALSTNTRPFSYINKQKDEFRLNVAQFQGVFNYENNVRGVLTFHTGDLLHTAWEDLGATDPTLQQANAGFLITDNIWVDAGYFLTHIGGELLLPKDNWITSHSLVTNFEPFYQTGVRFSYETPKITAQLHLLNGNGIFEDNNYNKSIGVFLGYYISDNINLTYSNVFGNEEPGEPSNSRFMMYHNFDIYYNIDNCWKFKALIDFANLEAKDELKSQSFWGISAEAQCKFLPKHAATIRASYIGTDENLFIEADSGYEFAVGIEHKPADMVYIRVEGRMLGFDDEFKPFLVSNKPASSRMEFMLNLGIVME